MDPGTPLKVVSVLFRPPRGDFDNSYASVEVSLVRSSMVQNPDNSSSPSLPSPSPPLANASLAEHLDLFTTATTLSKRENDRVRCLACGHRCLMASGQRGVCQVRFNRAGTLHAPYGYVAGLIADPVEKKPFFHLLPGAKALTFGMLGCNFHCGFCQNWLSSQALKTPRAIGQIEPITPEEIVRIAQQHQARMVVSSYNEPVITIEWAASVFELATRHKLLCAFVSNGHATVEALQFVRPWMNAIKIDLKTFHHDKYRALGGSLDQVTSIIRNAREMGFWVEVVTLLIPGFNDSDDELHSLTHFLTSVSPDIPWHVTAFHPDYQMIHPRPTQAGDLLKAVTIGQAEGLKYIYAGNLPGQVRQWEDTRCPTCKKPLVERAGFRVRSYRISHQGCCPDCHTVIPGIWS